MSNLGKERDQTIFFCKEGEVLAWALSDLYKSTCCQCCQVFDAKDILAKCLLTKNAAARTAFILLAIYLQCCVF